MNLGAYYPRWQARHTARTPYCRRCSQKRASRAWTTVSFPGDQFPSNYGVGGSEQNAPPSRGTFDSSPFFTRFPRLLSCEFETERSDGESPISRIGATSAPRKVANFGARTAPARPRVRPRTLAGWIAPPCDAPLTANTFVLADFPAGTTAHRPEIAGKRNRSTRTR